MSFQHQPSKKDRFFVLQFQISPTHKTCISTCKPRPSHGQPSSAWGLPSAPNQYQTIPVQSSMQDTRRQPPQCKGLDPKKTPTKIRSIKLIMRPHIPCNQQPPPWIMSSPPRSAPRQAPRQQSSPARGGPGRRRPRHPPSRGYRRTSRRCSAG